MDDIINVETTPQKLTKKSGAYPEVSAELKAATIRAALLEGQKLRRRYPDKVDLGDLEAVREATEAYESSCATTGVVPTFVGLCGTMNISRQRLYEYCNQHPESKTVQYLDTLRHQWAATRQQLAELRMVSEPMAIFMLKNAHLGLSDRAEIEVSQGPQRPFDYEDGETIRQRIIAGIPEPEEDELPAWGDIADE